MSSRSLAERYINAAKDGYLDVLQQATKRDLNVADEDGMTAVIWAAHNGHLDALRLIVGRGGDVDRCDYLGLTPLHHAAQKGFLHVVTYLVNWGVNIYALDNDHHSALNLANLYEKIDVVQYLDSIYAQQQQKNPKHVSRLQGYAQKHAERNIRRYEKLQEEAAKRAEKEQRKMKSSVSSANGTDGDSSSQYKQKNIIKTLTMAIRGSKSQRKPTTYSGKTYSDIAGLSHHTTGSRSGVAKKINQRRLGDSNGTISDGADFKIGDVDESGRRTLRSLPATQGVRSVSSEVMYLTGQRGDSVGASDVSSARPAVYEVFGGTSRATMFKAKSESDLLDSGTDSYFGDEDEDDENAPGIFNRPGFGKTAFLTGSNFLNTLPSFDGEIEEDEGAPLSKDLNGFQPRVNGDVGTSEGSGDLREEVDDWRGPKELPWDQEEVDTLDDDDEGMPSSTLETFLWSVGLKTYLHKFLQEHVDMELLVKMSDNELKEIGLPFGPRKRLLEAIKRRQEVLSMPKHMTDSFL